MRIQIKLAYSQFVFLDSKIMILLDLIGYEIELNVTDGRPIGLDWKDRINLNLEKFTVL